MVISSFDPRVFRGGAWNPGLLWQYTGGRWVRKVIRGVATTPATTANSVVVTNPVAGQVVTGSTFTPTATVTNGAAVTFLLDGTLDLGEPTQVGDRWSIPSRVTSDITDGSHTLTAAVTYINATTGTSAGVTFTVAKGAAPDPGGNGATTTLISITRPDSTQAVPTMSGGAFKPEVTIDPSLGAITAVSIAIGSVPDRGYLPAVDTGGGVWRMVSALDTVNYQANLVEAGTDAVRVQTLCDIWYDIQARVTLADTTIRFSPYVRALGRNEFPTPNGANQAWNPNKTWRADFTDLPKFVHSYDKTQTTGPNAGRSYQQTGGTYGKELGATTIVPDPDATNTYGHTAFGNVAFGDVPNAYSNSTAGMVNSFTGATYGTHGDQAATTGSLRWQFSTPCTFGEGDVAFYGYAFRLDPQFPTPTNSHISLGQIFGGANGGDYDWGLFLMLDAHTKSAEHGDTVADTFQIWGNRFNRYERAKLFQMPFYRGKWVSIVYGIGHSTDPRKGWLEIYTAQPVLNGGALTQWVFPSGDSRLPLVTLPKLSDGQPFHTHIYRRDNNPYDATKQWPNPNRARAHLYGMRTGPTAAAVNPNAYGTSIVYAGTTPPFLPPLPSPSLFPSLTQYPNT